MESSDIKRLTELEPFSEALAQAGAVGERPEIEIMILERPPQSLDEDIVLDASSAVHADGDVMILEQVREGGAGELGSLIDVEDLWSPIASDGVLSSLRTEVGLQGVLDTSHARTLRLYQSMTATRSMNPRSIGM